MYLNIHNVQQRCRDKFHCSHVGICFHQDAHLPRISASDGRYDRGPTYYCPCHSGTAVGVSLWLIQAVESGKQFPSPATMLLTVTAMLPPHSDRTNHSVQTIT